MSATAWYYSTCGLYMWRTSGQLPACALWFKCSSRRFRAVMEVLVMTMISVMSRVSAGVHQNTNIMSLAVIVQNLKSMSLPATVQVFHYSHGGVPVHEHPRSPRQSPCTNEVFLNDILAIHALFGWSLVVITVSKEFSVASLTLLTILAVAVAWDDSLRCLWHGIKVTACHGTKVALIYSIAQVRKHQVF